MSSPAELMEESPRRTRRAMRRIRPVRVMSGSVSDLPILTLQDPANTQGELVYDCRPPLLPMSLQLCDLGPLQLCDLATTRGFSQCGCATVGRGTVDR